MKGQSSNGQGTKDPFWQQGQGQDRLVCKECCRYLQKDRQPYFKHSIPKNNNRIICDGILCIWCLYDNYKSAYADFAAKFLKQPRTLQMEKQEYSVLYCCGRSCQGAMYDMKLSLKSNCCFDGSKCPEIKKGFDQIYQYPYYLTVGRKCYRKLHQKSQKNPAEMTKNQKSAIRQLNKLSTQKCEVCKQNKINFVIGKQHQINYHYCQKCFENSLSHEQIKILTPKQQTNQTFKSSKQLTESKNNSSFCNKCQQKTIILWDRKLFLTEYDKRTYCYYCLYEEFIKIREERQKNIITQAEYIQKLIDFQKVFGKHCIICGFKIESVISKTFIYVLRSTEMELEVFYCACCQKFLRENIRAFRNLINLKQLLKQRNELNHSQNNRVLVSQFLISKGSKLKELEDFKKELEVPLEIDKGLQKDKRLPVRKQFGQVKNEVDSGQKRVKKGLGRIFQRDKKMLGSKKCQVSQTKTKPNSSYGNKTDQISFKSGQPDITLKKKEQKKSNQYLKFAGRKVEQSFKSHNGPMLTKNTELSLDGDVFVPCRQQQQMIGEAKDKRQDLLIRGNRDQYKQQSGSNQFQQFEDLNDSEQIMRWKQNQNKIREADGEYQRQNSARVDNDSNGPTKVQKGNNNDDQVADRRQQRGQKQESIIMRYGLFQGQSQPFVTKMPRQLESYQPVTCSRFLAEFKEDLQIKVQTVEELNCILASPYFQSQYGVGQQTKGNQRISYKDKGYTFQAKQYQCCNCQGLDFVLSLGGLCQQCFVMYLMGDQKVYMGCLQGERMTQVGGRTSGNQSFNNKY